MEDFRTLKFNPEREVPPINKPESAFYHYNRVVLPAVERFNQAIAGDSNFRNLSPVEVIQKTTASRKHARLFSAASEIVNHKFFFESLSTKPAEVGPVTKKHLEIHFESVEGFKNKFSLHAEALSGSGWTWLIAKDGHLEIVNTFNNGTAFGVPGVVPIFAIDLWEHAYIFDHVTKKDYVASVFESVDWVIVEERIQKVEEQFTNLKRIGEQMNARSKEILETIINEKIFIS
eukprot:CAMPEP_0184335336 /NCGR_PEP_ID=MMETSP1089-20130417/3913_1 /TAXON_ID=38269 ORGANISM="Gloeochaete wittrockiana, Strain SAG46.84" /NCGR_SAMPLE_ID=MMETSP1089 /ASSEMBLY_ACC=CAM_ASM_000445 /LENGTH=231 /DNA_ID=CAMNT_0026659941 /DNA_START=103 /DNA_END=798 /DNA_ORIENTATION=-